jgi:hypothetical protein
MSYTSKQAARESHTAEQQGAKPSAQLFSDQRTSTSAQLKQQHMMGAEEEEPLQGKFATLQRAEEEELLQGKFATAQLMEEEEPIQGKFDTLQRASAEEEEPLQGKFNSAVPAQLEQKPNNTGLPDNLKSGIENMSGFSMDDVKVHYNSDKPAQLNAHAYAQGTDIHVAPGQEQHLPHEAWHVVQQKQGRVQPTMQMKAGVPVNDDAGLENEADVMGAKAVVQGMSINVNNDNQRANVSVNHDVAQLVNRVQQVHLTTMTNGNNRYMGVAGAAGAEPVNASVGLTQALGLDGWGGIARAPQEEFHRAHALANTLGGSGDNTNVAWWSKDDELAWTVKDEQVQGRRLAGFDENYRPSVNEEGNYTITSNKTQIDVKPNFRGELLKAVRIIQNATLNFQGAALTVADQAGIDWDTVRANIRTNFFNTANGRIDGWLDHVFTNEVGGVWKWDDITGSYARTVSTGGGRGQRRVANMDHTQTPAALNANDFGLERGNLAALWALMRDSDEGVFQRGNNPFRNLRHNQNVNDSSGNLVGSFTFTLGGFHQINVNFS